MNWGILSTGRIANVFAQAIQFVEGASLTAVASRTLEKAMQFQEKYGAAKAYGSYEELAKDGEIDIVYVATPMTCHYDDVKLMLENGRSVLCEKAITCNAAQFEELMNLAHRKNLFFMEAMWMKCHPGFRKALTWVQEGRIGELQSVRADMSKFIAYDANDRLFKKSLGGGALLDLGVYTTTLCCAFLGYEPDEIFACCAPTPEGTDYYTSVIMKYPGRFAAMNFGFGYPTPVSAIILGTEGRIEFDEVFFRTNSVSLYDKMNNRTDHFEMPHRLNGYEDEVEEVERCLADGLKESPLNPLCETLAVMRLLDRIGKKIGQ